MGDENSEIMNLDLNLSPTSPPDTEPRPESLSNESVSLEDWIEDQRLILRRESVNSRMRWRSLLRPPLPVVLELNHGGEILQTGEGSASLEERNDDVAKECENEATHVENEKLMKEEEKGSEEDESFFDCNICLEVSSDPVLTCCGHLFCWPCLHQWLNVHSDAKECPVCKGEVTNKNLIPIYGRGSISKTHGEDEKASLKIPDRPQARRVESVTESSERNSSLLNRVLTSRGMRQEQATATVPENEIIEIDLTQNIPVGAEVEARRLESHLQRLHRNRPAPSIELANITERLIDSYLRYTNIGRNQDLMQNIPADDRDSVSSIAAVIHSESQTMDNAVEIDSRVSASTSSSRRRTEGSRAADVDSGDSRALRRRRLN